MQNYHPRLNNYHSHKQNILGNQGARPAPAWKPNARAAASGSGSEVGSKILLSRLPPDVVENEVEILFSRTVGPVKDVFMVYNSQGNSRGMAIVSFTRQGDAAVARAKYNGKIVDGRRPIKIEIITDDDDARRPAPAPAPAPPSLLNRISPPTPAQTAAAARVPIVNGQKKGATAAGAAPVSGKVRLRTKKGPRRLNKQRGQQQTAQQQQAKQKPKSKTLAELDAEMEDYRAHGSEGVKG
ncbi:hypothetical protein OH76DRAFT_1406127 [Lentinus brumalis]|uniref:RRM domain-containing protein n=1 Tax=Lentinus brumalis TaxID=2498619 RepID=A0A371D414_9APHY|nr:hypothetical protein OH76DRAFT_1406127 [Polyporus brumalis]